MDSDVHLSSLCQLRCGQERGCGRVKRKGEGGGRVGVGVVAGEGIRERREEVPVE